MDCSVFLILAKAEIFLFFCKYDNSAVVLAHRCDRKHHSCQNDLIHDEIHLLSAIFVKMLETKPTTTMPADASRATHFQYLLIYPISRVNTRAVLGGFLGYEFSLIP